MEEGRPAEGEESARRSADPDEKAEAIGRRECVGRWVRVLLGPLLATVILLPVIEA
jgi:hypothetical protein